MNNKVTTGLWFYFVTSFNEFAWQQRRKHAKAWLFFTALFSMMLVSYTVIFFTVLSAYRQENRLLLEQINLLTGYIIKQGQDDFDELKYINFEGRDYTIVIFSPLDRITYYSNKPQENFTATASWQVYKQKTDTTFQVAKRLEAVRLLPDGYRMYVYLSSPYFYYQFVCALNLLPLLIFLVVLGFYVFYVNRQARAWQSLLAYSQTLQHQILNDFQPYPMSQRPLDLDIAQMGHTINRIGSQLHRYFHAIKALSRHQEQLIENTPVSLFILNRKGQITYFNQQFSKAFMTPFYADAVYLLSDFVTGKDKISQQQLLNIANAHKAVNITVADLQHQHFFELHLQPVYNHLGKVQGFSGCLQNVSDYHYELEAAWLNEKQQQDKLASFDKLWAVLGHELRTPLTGMLGMIEILDEEKFAFDSEQQEVIQTLQQSGQSMLQMLNDMLDIAKLGAGKLNTNIVQIDLFSLMRQVTELMVGNARRQQIDLIYHTDGQIPRYMETDDGRLRQILLNLLSNAIKFTRQGYVALLADLIEPSDPLIIENNTRQNPAQKWLRIMVKDTGMGISESEQKKLFSFFNQANESISRQFGGTGLGLAISNNFSQLLGGFIHLHSVVGEGSEFQVYLPLKNYRPQVSFTVNQNPYPFYLIIILKYTVSQIYVTKLFTRLKINFAVYIGLTQDNIEQINQQFVSKNSRPLFVIDEHCYNEHTVLLEQIDCFNLSPKIYLTMNTERSLPTAISEKFEGILTKPITMTNFLAEMNRVYDKFEQRNTKTHVPLSAQEAYAQFLVTLNKLTDAPLGKGKVAYTTPNHLNTQFASPLRKPPNQKILKNLHTLTFAPLEKDGNPSIGKNQIPSTFIELDSSKKSILVAEDNPVNQKIVQRHLIKLGYDVMLVSDGQQAIELLHTYKSQIGLILMDCQMPVMNGLEATRHIRAEQNSIPIIALTANHSDEDRQLCLSAGMDNVLTKPLNKEALLRLLSRYMI